jgi:hypothetical protein
MRVRKLQPKTTIQSPFQDAPGVFAPSRRERFEPESVRAALHAARPLQAVAPIADFNSHAMARAPSIVAAVSAVQRLPFFQAQRQAITPGRRLGA